ncbi:MAG: GTP-binding protein, partial [Proteobacteria bacterium]|nr:GTP-binding protein [Pseudomonadota bacterium]
QFFLTRRSLYVFVWEARQEYHDLGFYYWLNVVGLLSANSPVIVVMNKKDVREKAVDEATLRDKFPNIVGFHKVSCASGDGIKELRERIQATLMKLPHIGAVWSKNWTDIRKKLETSDRDYINHKEYLDICAGFEMDAKKANHLARYFHDLAGILNFQDNPLLKNFIILKPEWATHAVYDVLDTRGIQQNMGRFNFTDLENIWDEAQYPASKHPHLLELMKKFELVFQFEDSIEYLAPELLPGDKPSFPWDETNNLRFEYRYDFMPKGVITRFTVRNHTLIEKDYY